MFQQTFARLGLIALAGAAFFMFEPKVPRTDAAVDAVATPAANPLLTKWSGPYGGLPPFDKINVSYFKPALEAAMVENLAEIDAIASNKAAPTFENTFVPLEKAGDTLNRVGVIFGIWASNMNTPDFQPVQAEMQPKLAAHNDKIVQNGALFKRIEAVYNSPAKKRLTIEQQRLVRVYYENFVHAGAALDPAKKTRLAEINQELAGLFTTFNQNLQGEESGVYMVIDHRDSLAGLPQSLIDSAAEAAASKNMPGKWIIRNTRSSVDPFLTYSDRRDLREKAWRMFIMRGDNGDARDNKEPIKKILKLRAERAHLFGLPTHAHWILQQKMAKDPENAMKLMLQVWPAAVARVKEEVADMQALANKQGAKIKIEAWDYRYYMEKVRKDKYDLDQNEVKPYLQLDKMREAMMWVAGELFNFNFKKLDGIATFNPDMVVYEVTNKTTGKHVGVWYFDPYARDGKDSGAWMSQYRNQARVNGDITTIVSNNANFVKGKPGEPVLISWDDAETMFHEFGHALHGLSSNVTYPALSGTAVATDYVEFPSQLLEHWVGTPQVLNRFALHYQTGKPMPQTLIDKINKASKFNQGFATLEYLSSALYDMKIHLEGDKDLDPSKFEKDYLGSIGMPSEIVMRHRPTQFRHIFASDDYSAGYYSYLWSDVLKADAYTAFTEAGGPYDKKVAARLVKYVFSVGNTIPQDEGFRFFRGRDPQVKALMEERGFPVPK
ncbi:MAG TPA: M3 family metallopeptidase [Pyrinomonadaceae bacterium]|jgi:peptidyl-dipeptidase Dcp|nr:M3 family metallopeptidase [Pyrinomonadaceae bacterium]